MNENQSNSDRTLAEIQEVCDRTAELFMKYPGLQCAVVIATNIDGNIVTCVNGRKHISDYVSSAIQACERACGRAPTVVMSDTIDGFRR